MQIKFSSDLIKITFEESEPFSKRTLMMYGEVLQHGFAAITATMTWLSPIKHENVSDFDKRIVRSLLSQHNQKDDFRVELIEE